MIDERSITNKEALHAVKQALQDLMLFFPLCGLSYFGEAVQVREERSIRTLMTDGRRVFYSPDWINGITPNARIFDLLHEWLHIFFNHVARTGDRNKKTWNVAADMVVVREACLILSRGGNIWTAPPDGIIPQPWAADMTAEEIYDELMKQQSLPAGKGSGEHESGEDFAEPEHDPSVGEEEDFLRTFMEEIAQAVLIQEQITSTPKSEMLTKAIRDRLTDLEKSTVPWSRLLRGTLISQMGQVAPTYSPPRMRYFPAITLPSMRSLKEEKLIILIDVSTSVGPRLLKTFVSNVLPAAQRANEVMIVTFDSDVRETIRTKNPKAVFSSLTFQPGHHKYTSVVSAFDIVEAYKPKAIVCLTDGEILLPTKTYPQTLWVIPQGGRSQPWGRNFVMDVSW